MSKVAIIGVGHVGKAMQLIFPDAILYDKAWHTPRDQTNSADLAVVCVPTPALSSGECDTSAVVEVVGWLRTPLILIKSTVPPGTVDELRRLFGKRVCFSPEYIGESTYHTTPWHFMDPSDPRLHDFLIIGGDPQDRAAILPYFVRRLGPEKTYFECSALEAEIIKYMENAYFGLKVAFCHQFHALCTRLGASYTQVREGWLLDNRIGRMHTAVFDRSGFGGKCLPKDLAAIATVGRKQGMPLTLIEAALAYNESLK